MLVLLVLLQIKERKLTSRQLIRPLVILGVAVANYLHGIPDTGKRPAAGRVFAVVGGLIGVASGVTVIMHRKADGAVTFRSGWRSGLFWVLGMGSRFAFVYWSTHGGVMRSHASVPAIRSPSAEAWTAALLAMAVFEVCGRTATMALRWRGIDAGPSQPWLRTSSASGVCASG